MRWAEVEDDSQKHSRKMAQGSVFYLCSARHGRVEQGAAAGLRSECSARYCHGHKPFARRPLSAPRPGRAAHFAARPVSVYRVSVA